MTSHDIHEQAAAYVLHALDDDELRAFEEHLVGCTVCQEELESLRSAAAAIAYDTDLRAPPAQLRARILDEARAESSSNVIPLRRRFLAPGAAVLAAAAACAAIALGVWASSLSGSLNRERDARRAQTQALAIIAAPGSRRFALDGSKGALVVAPNEEAALVVSGLPRAPDGMTYEVWILPNGKALPAGLFAGGPDRSIVTLTRLVPRHAKVAVSVEPAGGSQTLTGQVLITTETA